MNQTFPEYPSTVFRFRTCNPLSLKELQYGEIFFSTKDELNDPYDTKKPSFYKNDYGIIKRLIQFIIGQINQNLNSIIDIDSIAQYIVSAGDGFIQDELIDILNSLEFERVVLKAFAKCPMPNFNAIFIRTFKMYVINAGGVCYIASFSKCSNDPVIWSHYANHHKGFCLCFTIQDTVLKPRTHFQNDFFKEECKFEEVIYNDRNNFINAFYLFPKPILGHGISDDERLSHWASRRQSYLTKYSSWSYEQEIRIIVDSWFNTMVEDDKAVKRLIADRTFCYDQSQLTGIIFGSKMGKVEREEIRATIDKMRADILRKSNIKYLPIFTYYQAKENSQEFKMNIVPIDALDAINKIFAIDQMSKKQEEYKKLKEFYIRQQKMEKQDNI